MSSCCYYLIFVLAHKFAIRCCFTTYVYFYFICWRYDLDLFVMNVIWISWLWFSWVVRTLTGFSVFQKYLFLEVHCTNQLSQPVLFLFFLLIRTLLSQLSCKGVQYFDLKSRKEMNGHFLNPDILVFVCIQFLFPPCQSIDCCHANISCIFFIDFLSKWYHYFAPRLKNHCPLISYIDDNLKNKYFLCVVTSRHVKHPPRCQISAILVSYISGKTTNTHCSTFIIHVTNTRI